MQTVQAKVDTVDIMFYQPITFNSVGTYYFIMRQMSLAPNTNCLTGHTRYHIRVEVVNNNGNLHATVQYQADTPAGSGVFLDVWSLLMSLS
jgi:pilin isopeptide linkage protein